MAEGQGTDVLDAIVSLTKNVSKELGIETDEKECNGSETRDSGDTTTHSAYSLISQTYKQFQQKLKDVQAQLDMANEKVCGLQSLLDKSGTKAPASGGRRGRGRPKKAGVVDVSPRRTMDRPTKVLSYAESDHISSEDSDAYVPQATSRSPRGRGRPRGAPGRGRGRGARGKRGRPRKEGSSGGANRRGQPRKNYNEFESRYYL